MRRRRTAAVAGATLVAALWLLAPAEAWAHPLGNFTVNHYAGLTVAADGLAVDYVVDLAEIPAFQERASIDRDGDGQLVPAELVAYRTTRCQRLARGLRVQRDGTLLALATTGTRLTAPPGQGGLDTLRLECRYHTDLDLTDGQPHTLAVTDTNNPDRIGWREITATSRHATLVDVDVPNRSISDRLTDYPEDLLRSPPDTRQATLTLTADPTASTPHSSPARTAAGPAANGPLRTLTGLLTGRRLTVTTVLLAAAVALLLGAVHALAPGHGKTIMAAYLIGQHGRARHAAWIGSTVAATHTAGVLALGLLIATSHTLVPERLYPWLTTISGLTVAAIGAALLHTAIRTRTGHHAHPHTHSGHHHLVAGPGSIPRRRELAALGFAGGLVPSPSALIVLLGAMALQRTWLGLIMVAIYGVGMATVLVITGWLLAGSRQRLDRWKGRSRHPRAARWATNLPVATAGLIVLGGVTIATRAITSL
ncbi:MAG TPA: hypothetical protein VHF25_04950 [Nitriliruptorales bacterium]|nr:hypothetical protein [Nitriliruptorales bacterium]